MAICLERSADLHVVQLVPLPLTVSCFHKIQIGFTFLLLAHLGSPGNGPFNGCVCGGGGNTGVGRFGCCVLCVSPSRIQSTPGSRTGTTVDVAQRPQTAATQSATQAGNQGSASQTGSGSSAQDLPVPAVPPRIQLSDLQNILSRLERTPNLCLNNLPFASLVLR